MGTRRVRTLALTGLLMIGLVGGAVPAAGTAIGNEGCTLGFWKNNTGQWEEYVPTQTVESVFNVPASLSSLGDDTLLEALNYGGGAGLLGKAKILLRQAVAAVLNAAHEGVGYPLRRDSDPGMIIATTNAALSSGNQSTMTDLAATYDAKNNLGCPLDADESAGNR